MASIKHTLEISLDDREYDRLRSEAKNLALSVEAWIKRRLGLDAARPPARAVIAAPAPAPAPVAPAPISRARDTSRRDSLGTPLGLPAIAATVRQFASAREQAIKASFGASAGRSYNLWIGAWYKKHGFADIPKHQRAVIVALRHEIDEIVAYAEAHPRDFDDPDLTPAALNYRWRNRPAPPPFKAPSPVPSTQLRKKPEPAPPVKLQAPVFEPNGKIRMVNPEELFRKPKAPAEDVVASEEPPVEVGNFDEVDLGELAERAPYAERVLRRFAGRLINQGEVSEHTPPEDIAAAVERIRGKEKGNTPKCAETLVQLGVMWGNSGQYKIRPEFAERFEEVCKWAMMPA